MIDPLIVPITQTCSRHLLNLEDARGGIGSVEVRLLEPRTVQVLVELDDDDVLVQTIVKSR